jgi:hypothetical protein
MAPRTERKLRLEPGRWLAYTTASAATALTGATSAEGHIHYSGLINAVFNSPAGTVRQTFPLEHRVSIYFTQVATEAHQYDYAFVGIKGGRGSRYLRGGYFPSRLEPRETVSDGTFILLDRGRLAAGRGFTTFYYSQWRDRGPGFVGFAFNNGNGPQYGWARVKTSGANRNAFVLVDYAWGDPGDVIVTGQKQDRERSNAPASGSIGFLALGAAGLLVWRGRAQNK